MKVDACEELRTKLRNFLHCRQLNSLIQSSLTVGLYYVFKYIRGALHKRGLLKLVVYAKKLARFLEISIPTSVELIDGDEKDKQSYVEQQETRIAETILERLEHPTGGTDCEDGFQGDISYLFHESRPFEHSRDTSVDPCAQPLHHGYIASINKDGIIISIDIDLVKWKSKQSLRNQIDSLVHRQTWPSETKENKKRKALTPSLHWSVRPAVDNPMVALPRATLRVRTPNFFLAVFVLV